VWKQSTAALTEGREIDAYTLKDTAVDSLRASSALVLYDKRNLTDNDDISSFKKGAQNEDNQVISEALYKEHKYKRFDNNVLIGSNAANLLTQRYVARFKFTPFSYRWTTQERFLTFKTGDVIDINANAIQSASGLPSTELRAQITKIMPKYGRTGRTYDCTAMSYEAAFNNNSESVIDNPIEDYSLYGAIGAPSTPFTHTFILKGSYSRGSTGFRAGDVPPAIIAGSKIILIFVDGFDGQASGGTGGDNEKNGVGGGTVYDAQGVDTDIYFSGDTSAISAAYPVADGYIRAPGGGGGGGSDYEAGSQYFNGGGGGGGAGRLPGVGGISSSALPADVDGENGFSGDIDGVGGAGGTGFSGARDGGNGGNWGQPGALGEFGQLGGLAGSGVRDGGATVTFFGSTALRYINGNGDHP
tara:strand:- start:80 stop:1324 length:1245 start_codon:yes stop_codon:yes gene_type:complete